MLELKSLSNILTLLHSRFDDAIMNGSSFEEVKKIYLQIKEVEREKFVREVQVLKGGRNENKAKARCNMREDSNNNLIKENLVHR